MVTLAQQPWQAGTLAKVSCVEPMNVYKDSRASDVLQAAASGDTVWLGYILRRYKTLPQRNKEGLSALHLAALHGKVAFIEVLLKQGIMEVDVLCPWGRTPLHLAFGPLSAPHTLATASCLLKHGAQVNAVSKDGLTPLHQAAAEGQLESVRALLAAGANPYLTENNGHTPLDMAKIMGHREVGRHLKDTMWRKEKRSEETQRKKLQRLREGLEFWQHRHEFKEKEVRQEESLEKAKVWAKQKGVPLQWWESEGGTPHVCRTTQPPRSPSNPHPHPSLCPKRTKDCQEGPPKAPRQAWNPSTNPRNPPKASIVRPQGVRIGTRPQTAPPVPDLRRAVSLTEKRGNGGGLCYKTRWDAKTRPTPKLPLNVVKRELFPADYPARLGSPTDFHSRSVLDLPRVRPQERTSPWTEVAMHLVEELPPGLH